MTYKMRIVERDGHVQTVMVKHNVLDIRVLVAKALLWADLTEADIKSCSMYRG